MVDLDPADEVDAPAASAADDDAGAPDEAAGDAPGGLGGLAIAAFGAFLAVAYFPLLFDKVARYDDEGFYLTSIRQFVSHGSLYGHTRSAYGPFYYSFMGALFRLTGQHPTLFNGRLIVLVLTSATGCMFGATIYRVTRALSLSMLGQFASFLILMRVAGNEPMHPASLLLLLLSVVAYALACFVMTERPMFLVVAGGAAGAIAMCKINVGIFALAAIAMGFVIGNRQFTKPLRRLMAVAIVALPFVLVLPRAYDTAYVQFAALVGLALLATLAPLHVDEVSLPARTLLERGAGRGRRRRRLGDLAAPARHVAGRVHQGHHHRAAEAGRPPRDPPHLESGLDPYCAHGRRGAVRARAPSRRRSRQRRERARRCRPGPTLLGSVTLPHVAFAAVALWVFGLGLGFSGFHGNASFGAWMPPIALLCAFAWTTAAPKKIRIALRFLVPLAILQSLHAYPVAGSQQGWATVAVFAPAAIALAAALDRLPTWHQVGNGVRWLAVASLGLVFTFSVGLWPISIWHSYNRAVALGLPGARLVHVPKETAQNLKQLTRGIKRDCDTFYSAPGLDSLYVYTGITPPTGILSNHPGVLNTSEQTEVASQLAALQNAGKRVCIVPRSVAVQGVDQEFLRDGPARRRHRPVRQGRREVRSLHDLGQTRGLLAGCVTGAGDHEDARSQMAGALAELHVFTRERTAESPAPRGRRRPSGRRPPGRRPCDRDRVRTAARPSARGVPRTATCGTRCRSRRGGRHRSGCACCSDAGARTRRRAMTRATGASAP